LNLAWQAGSGSIPPTLLEFNCIAVDECQDLTPLEAYLIARVAATIRERTRTMVPVLLAGDEAQTVRPTDFEWGWFNDLFHTAVGTPSEFKLSANLRSPRRIAEMVNRVWDL
jgi:superfamily I DNA/RNA helicase